MHVVDEKWFSESWFREHIHIRRHNKTVSFDEIKDRRERKRLLLKERQSLVPCGCECWAIYERAVFPQIVYAVRGDNDGGFTYLHTEEGWSLSGFPYASRRKGRFAPLIHDIVGNPRWRGENSTLFEKHPNH